ncbi:Sodium/hydrogen exchanger family-domain-containing protein [Mucor mucedo]|uniref:Sodium/hydrogen exchanger family-domain-containing protein n=1 Tax=Mucor mucedo TaxID=29922 RepID=UPI00222103FD|nr:Sodium/hydrogen exchanger family-domain-containing protein [Mucor mucedo]KAI7894307.1 Sodium/hydrogen exchanger family-domain-containing protein [Mucor mucedo]
MAVGIDLPKHYMKKEWLTMLMLLLPVMIFMWLVSGLFIWWLVPPIDYLHSLVIAACVCPTDPILANSVVKGRFAEKHVPAHIRNALSAESGANDGMGFPFLFLALFLISEPQVGTAIGKWIYITLLFQIVLSCVIGLAVGWVARKILQWSERNHLIDKPSFLCFAIALALFLMSMTGFSGSDDLLACFVAGNAFSWDDWFRQETEEAHFQDVIDMMLNLAVFVYIGAIIPWSDFGNAELGLTPWRLVVIAILILVFRRLPILIILKPVMPALKTYREAIFSGWFGPMGVGAVFLAMVAKEQMEVIYHDVEEPPVTIELIKPVVLFIVLSSTLVHGTTIPLFKIGNRIRTRTLSIASTGSGQVLRLPKLQFGQQINMRRDEAHNQEHAEAMSQLKRNTLLNTIQQQQSPHHPQSQDHTIQMHDDDDYDGLNEEDFLPDESDETEVGGYDESTTPSNPALNMQQQHHMPAAPTTESQSIRFLEPVNPRAGSASQNMDRNDASVSSFRSWMNRNKEIKEEPGTEDVGVIASNPPAHSGGLRNLFRRHNKDNVEDNVQADMPPSVRVTSPDDEEKEQHVEPITAHPSTLDTLKNMFPHHHQEQDTIIDVGPEKLSRRIEVWDEPNHVVIEDKRDASSHSVIDKSDPNWKVLVKEKINQLQYIIDNEVDEKRS